ncbi:MAG TPA: diacylglycerol kinase family protein [Acidobacteriaceae bacterium]
MRRAAILYNPNSGRPGHRIYYVEGAAAALRQQNIDVTIIATEGPGTAGKQATALADDHDIIFVGGGDGTIHEVAQGLAFHPHATLGIVPFGSANALCRHIGIDLNPIRAVRQQINFTPQTIPLGRVIYTTPAGEQSRYFVVMAGAGSDGALVYKMLADSKQAIGRFAYYHRAARLFAKHHFAPFDIGYTLHDGTMVSTIAVSAMAVRVADLGGLFSSLVRGASIEHPHLTLAIASSPARLSLPAWFATSWTRTHRWNPFVQTVQVDSFHCGVGTDPVQVQADGEWLGQTPMTVTLIPNALRLLMPPTSPPEQ